MNIPAEQPIDHYRSEFSSRESHLPGAAIGWLREKRRISFERFADSGFPCSRREEWKYTPVEPIIKRTYRVIDDNRVPPELDGNSLEALYLSGANSHCLVFLNGVYVPQLSRLSRLPGGVIVGSIADGFVAPSEVFSGQFQHHFDHHIVTATSSTGFSALNSAFFADGAFIYLPPDAVVEPPIQLLFLSTLGNSHIISHPRILIVAEQDSQVDVVESFASLGEPVEEGTHLINAVTEISLGSNAQVRHCKLQNEREKAALHIAGLAVYQEKDSRFFSYSISVGGKFTRNDINAVIDAEGGACSLDGLYLAGKRQHVDYYTRIEHTKPYGTSVQRYKGILAGRAHGVFNGQVYVHPYAQHTDAKQRNENLLLSKDAQVDTKPQLDIFADDVQCAHGATVGKIDKKMIFYLRSRGIAANVAKSLLTYAFASEIVERIPIEAIRTKLTEIVLTQLPDADQARERLQELVPSMTNTPANG